MTRLTKVDWEIIDAALAYAEAASYGEEEFGQDGVPEGFRSWNEYYKRATQTREKVGEKLNG